MFRRTKAVIIKIDDFREEKENKVADLMDKIGKNEAYIKIKNEGADKLVALGIQTGITLAESQSNQDITISQETIDRISDKGGDKLVGIWDSVMSWVKKLLRK